MGNLVTNHLPGGASDRRQHGTALQCVLHLIELPPPAVVECKQIDNGCYIAPNIVIGAALRESCPHCGEGHLKMVLRQRYVRRSHVYCERCTRCFEAKLPDGSLAL